MASPRMYGMKTAYTPNSKADMRFRKNIWQHNREIAESASIRKYEKMLLEDERKLMDMKKGNGGESCV